MSIVHVDTKLSWDAIDIHFRLDGSLETELVRQTV